jgi:hypothetical protein
LAKKTGVWLCWIYQQFGQQLDQQLDYQLASNGRSTRLHWRDGRVAEGTGLLNRRMGFSCTEGSNPSLSAIYLVATCSPFCSMDIEDP